jgi:hypothetical protein
MFLIGSCSNISMRMTIFTYFHNLTQNCKIIYDYICLSFFDEFSDIRAPLMAYFPFVTCFDASYIFTLVHLTQNI